MQDASEVSGSSYAVYEKCNECPVYLYRDAVCNDNLSALVKEGEPSEEVLREARQRLMVEFAELSGDTNLISANREVARIIGYNYRIQALSVAISIPEHTEAQKLFARYGWEKLSAQMQVKRATAKIKEYQINIDKESARQKKRVGKGSNKRLSESDFNRQIIIVSKWVGFHLSDRMTLSELAGYFRNYCETIKSNPDARNYKKY